MRPLILATALTLSTALAAAGSAGAAEICGNGADDDANSRVDEGCDPYSVTGICWSPLDCDTTGAVSPRTGNYVWRGEQPDVVITPPSGPKLRFHRFYMSQYEPGYSSWTFKSNLGKYWSHSYMSWLTKTTTPNPDEVVLHLPTGEEVWFSETSSSSTWANYTPQSGRDFVRLRQCKTTGCGYVAQYDWELVLLTGESYFYDGSTTGDHTAKLIKISQHEQSIDLAYDGTTGFLKTVTSPSGRKYRLKLEYYASEHTNADLLSKVIAQSCDDSGGECDQASDWDDDKTFLYTYESDDQLSEVLRDDSTDVVIAAYTYDGDYLSEVRNAAAGSTQLARFEWLDGSPGKLANLEFGGVGAVGYTWDDSSCDSGNGVIVLFNKKNSTRCDEDSDCDGGYCGGEYDPDYAYGPTGICYQAKMCVKSTTSNGEHLLTGDFLTDDRVTCGSLSDGRCIKAREYTWDTTELRLKGIESPDSVWTSYTYNTNGLVTKMVENDTDDDASTVPDTEGDEGRATWFFYDNSSFPGFITEIRRLSDLKPGGSCDASTTTDCRRERWTHTITSPNGLVNTYQLSGFTMKNCSTTCAISTLSIVYDWDYDSYARVTALHGPMGDDTLYTYYDDSGDANTHRYRRVKEVQREVVASTTYLTTTYSNYDSWGNAQDVAEPSRLVCRSFEPNWGLLATSRVVIDTGSSQTTCSADDTGGTDETTTYSYDNLRRLDLLEKPKGNCVDYSYDTKNRVSTIKELDDASGECASTGNYREFTYDEDGLLIKEEWKDSGGTVKKRQEYTYANDRRMASMINPENTEVAKQWDYRDDGLPSVLKHEDWTSGNAKTEQMGYNDLDQLESHAKYKDGSTADEWIFERSTFLGLPLTITDEAGHEIEPQWDDAGRKIKETTSEANVTIWEYDAGSRVIQYMQDWGGAEQKKDGFSYDLANRMTGWNTADYCGTTANEYQYSYDSASGSACPSGTSGDNLSGRLACVKAKMWCDTNQADKSFDQFTVYSYDDAGRIASTTITDDGGSRTATITYAYDLNGNVTSIGYPGDPSASSLNLVYDGAGVASDADRVRQMKRDTTVFADNITWLPFGPFDYLLQSNQYNGGAGGNLRRTLTWNEAYRLVKSCVGKGSTGCGSTIIFQIEYSEDERGRYTARDFTYGSSGQKDMFFLYDDLDRVTCRRDSSGSTCPSSGFRESFAYNTSNDRSSFTIQNAVYTTSKTFTPIYVSGSDKIDCLLQDGSGTDCSSNSGGYIIDMDWDRRGNRKYDDSDELTGSSDDKRSYTYDARNNLITVTGKFYHAGSGTLHDYVLTNAYDEHNRRIFKSFKDTTPNPDVESQTFFYYDQWDRLIQAKHTPDIDTTTTYSVYQWYWLERRPVLYYQIDCTGSGCTTPTTTRRYLHSDEQGRPHAAWSWPTSGDATRVWEVEAGTFGWDVVTVGGSLFQPLGGLGSFADAETIVASSAGTIIRPALALGARLARFYGDVLVGGDISHASDWSYGVAEANGPHLAACCGTTQVWSNRVEYCCRDDSCPVTSIAQQHDVEGASSGLPIYACDAAEQNAWVSLPIRCYRFDVVASSGCSTTQPELRSDVPVPCTPPRMPGGLYKDAGLQAQINQIVLTPPDNLTSEPCASSLNSPSCKCSNGQHVGCSHDGEAICPGGDPPFPPPML